MANLAGHPVISWTIQRVSLAKRVDHCVVATSTLTEDDDLAQWCKSHSVEVFRGDPNDVLDRYYQCSLKYQADHIVRVTGDCPMVDPEIVDRVATLAIDDSDIDYGTNGEPLSYPEGMTVEIIPQRTLYTAWKESTLPGDREHVTPFIRFQPERFRHGALVSENDISNIRLTVDYPDDLSGLTIIMATLSERGILQSFTLQDLVQVWNDTPSARDLLSRVDRDLWRKAVVSEYEQADSGPGKN